MAIVYASDWNPVIQKMRGVLTTPDGTTNDLGYNTTYSASNVASGVTITGAQWNNLRTDINKARTLQTGSNSAITTRSTTSVITSADLTSISAAVDTAYDNRGTVDTGQLNLASHTGYSNSGNWNGFLNGSSSITWSDANKCRGFWNAGGRVVWTFSRSGGDATTQNQTWSNLCTNVGSIVLTRTGMFQSGQTWNGTFYNSWNTNGAYGSRTTSLQQAFLIYGQDASYTANYIRLYAKWDDADVKLGRILTWQVDFVDDHVGISGGPDNVNGTISVNVASYYPFSNSANTP